MNYLKTILMKYIIRYDRQLILNIILILVQYKLYISSKLNYLFMIMLFLTYNY